VLVLDDEGKKETSGVFVSFRCMYISLGKDGLMDM
jgi:hypothetical protein